MWSLPLDRVKYVHRLLACRMRRQKSCHDSSAYTAWDYASLPCNLYPDAGPKYCHNFQTSRAKPPLNPFYTWCKVLLLAGLHHSHVVSNPLPLPSIFYHTCPSLLPSLSSVMCTRVRGNHYHISLRVQYTRKILRLKSWCQLHVNCSKILTLYFIMHSFFFLQFRLCFYESQFNVCIIQSCTWFSFDFQN